ncbi:MAG: ABC transporter ATP-binding protein [Gemmatimonadaceae bacterium]
MQVAGNRILREITMQVQRGERFVVVGPSGAGKTTLLRAIAGFVAPDSGDMTIAGRDVMMLPPEQRDAVYMHQTPVLFPHLSVFENVAFPLRVRQVPAAQIRERAGAALDAMQMGDSGNRTPRSLSGGQRHRVALARAIVARPALLLLDEPFSALDPALKRDIRAALLAAHAQYDPGLIVVTHDFVDAAGIADRIGVIIGGQLVQVAPPSTLFTQPASLDIARFLNTANEVRGEADGAGNFSSRLGDFPVPHEVPAGPAVAVFTAAAVRVGLDGADSARVTEVRVYPEHTTLRLDVSGESIEAASPVGGSLAVGTQTTAQLDPAKIVVFPVPPSDTSGYR